MTTLATGRVLGRFRVIGPLGRGGMAAVYRAEETKLGREVALKVLPAELMEQAGFLERFEREAQVIAQLEHPNIVPLYASGIDEGIPWMALRLLSHGTLQERLEAGVLGTKEGLQLFAHVAKALDHAHAHGVLHRDLKPQNVLLCSDGSAYLADFGIARILAGSTALTGTGMMLGTPSYMAPEQAQGSELGAPCDFYALAVMLYRWLCGQVPFDADTPLAVLMKHVQEPVPLEPMQALSPAVREVLLKGLDKDPLQRWQTASAMVQALDRALHTDSTPSTVSQARPSLAAPPIAAKSPTGSYARPRRMSLIVLPVLLLGGLFAGMQFWPDGGENADAVSVDPTASDRPAVTAAANSANPDPEDLSEDAVAADASETAIEAWPAIDVAADEVLTLNNPAVEPPTERMQAEAADLPATSTAIDSAPLAAPAAEQPTVPSRSEQPERVSEPSQRAPVPADLALDSAEVETVQSPTPATQQPTEPSGSEQPERGLVRPQTQIGPADFTPVSSAVDAAPRPALVAQQPATAPLIERPELAAEQSSPRVPGAVFRDCPQCPELVVIPAGRLLMGSPADEPQRQRTEGPQREVNIGSFALAKFETRFAEWDVCLAEGGCRHRPADRGWGGGDQPVIDVSWNDVQDYLAWLSARTSQRYRLPSEAEWEYAARAGTTGRHYRGDCLTSDLANFNAHWPALGCSRGEYRGRAVPVGSFPANPFGLHDMHGNVWEWVQDCANRNYQDAPVDGSAWMRGDCNRGTVRGGAWHDWGFWLRAAARYSFPRTSRHAVGGFRVLRELP